MNRRSLFKLLAGAACAAAIELTGLRPRMPKAAQYVVNPEYVNAAYENVTVVFNPPYEGMGSTLMKYPTRLRPMAPNADCREEADSPRFHFINGQYVQVPK
jgi:hypothetical protein